MDMQEQPDHSPLTLFYSYADEDEQLCKELEKHLNILQRQGMIAGWHRRKILPGEDLNQINDEQFSSAQIIILLISPDFLASDAYHSEMELALQRHRAGLAHVIPLLLRPVDWQPAPIAHLQVLPRNGIAVTKWEDRDEAFADIAKDIRLAITQWNGSLLPQSQRSPTLEHSYLFLSSARKDLPLVNRLKEDLQGYNIMGEKDHNVSQSVGPDKDEKEGMREAISSALAVILVGSPQTRRSRLVKQELGIAAMYQRPVSLFWMQGERLAEVMPTGRSDLPVIDARGERYAQALQELAQALGRQTSFSQVSPSEEPTTALSTPRNPYKGLQAFHIEDAQDFFGRDRLIDELLEKVRQLLTMDQQGQGVARLLTVLGPSGSGKSSVVMAGLIPKLKHGGLAGSEQWIYLDPMVPGKSPLEALTLTLTPLFPERSLKSIREDLEDDSARGLHLLLTASVKPSGASVLLVIDQFEELFTQTAIEDERRQFLDLLLTAVTEPGGPLITVITLRADFYDRPLLYPELGHIIENHHVTAYPLETRDLRAVIERPAQLSDVQLTFEEGLVGDLLFDVQGQVGALPLLEFTLDQLFQYREERLLTMHAYQRLGGVKGALAQHAELTYQSLPTEKHQRLARALFLRLINPGTLAEDATRRRIPLSELVVIDQEETTQLTEVTNTFTKARLLTTNIITGVSTVEVSHEALIQSWVGLQDWLQEARDDIRLQQSITEDTAEWNRYQQPTDRLYRGSQLAQALKWRASNLPSLDEDRFLQASIKERFRSRRRTFLIGLVSAAGVASIAGTGYFVILSRGNGPKPPLALPYIYKGHSDSVWSVAWSPDGTRIASGSSDQTVQVWDASNGSLLLTYKGHSNSVHSVAWSPDGTRIASGSSDQTVQVWDASNGSLLLTYKGHSNSVHSVAWSPDGTRIASGSSDQTVQVWDASNGRLLLTYSGHSNSVHSVAWSPDGTRIASGSNDKTVQVLNASNGSLLLKYSGHTDSIWIVAWSPDGTRIASGSLDQTAQVWDANSGSLLLKYSGHIDSVYGVAWSIDGKRIASGSYDKTVQIWDVSDGRRLFTYKGYDDSVLSVAWSPDSQRIASASYDPRIVQVWDATSINAFLFNQSHASSVESVAWSPDGTRVASGSDDKTVIVWDANNGNPLLKYTGHSDSVYGVAWSPDGKSIASGSNDETVQVWDANSGSLQLTYKGHSNWVESVAWSPDGTRIASGSGDETVQVWNASNGGHLLTYKGHSNSVECVAWSPDGQRIASSSFDKTVRVWNASDGRLLLKYTGHTNYVWSVAWSPDGKRIASGSEDRTVQVWDTNSGHLLLTYRDHTNSVHSVAWSPDGKFIASGSDDKTAQVWDANSGRLLLKYIGHKSYVWSVEWSPEGKRIVSGSDDWTVQVWDASVS